MPTKFPQINRLRLAAPQGPSTPLASAAERGSLNSFVARPLSAYGNNGRNIRANLKSLGEKSGNIPRGAQMYRALSPQDVTEFSKLKPGQTHSVRQPMSFLGPSELQELGKIDHEGGTGGGRQNAIASIEAADNVPGIHKVNEFLHASRPGQVEGFKTEGLLHEGTDLRLHHVVPGTDNSPDVYHFTAHRATSSQQLRGQNV